MKELTDEQLNIAICRWKGWFLIPYAGFDRRKIPAVATVAEWPRDLPSHITGPEALGNMHEAEKGLTTNQQWGAFIQELEKLIEDKDEEWFLVHTTARQRAIALLRVVKPELFQ